MNSAKNACAATRTGPRSVPVSGQRDALRQAGATIVHAWMKRDWTVIAIGLCFAVVATLLVVLSWPDRLPSCDEFRGSIDGTGGEECGDGLRAWTGRSLAAAVLACILGVIAVTAIAIGARRRPVDRHAA
jgi:hypothetical protein